MEQTLTLKQLLDRLGRKEQELKKAGAYAEAAGIRTAIVTILRMADEETHPIDPSDEP